MKELNLKLTVDEVNIILESLGGMPYVKVAELIAKLQNQISPQMIAPPDLADLSADEAVEPPAK